MAKPKPLTLDRLLERIQRNEDSACWIWTGGLDGYGYGVVRRLGSNYKVHRLVYEFTVGPISDGLTIDHLCRNRHCCNPDHLEPVTRGENVRRGLRLITHCPYGHPYSPDNTYVVPRTGHRQCRVCQRRRATEAKTRKKVAVNG